MPLKEQSKLRMLVLAFEPIKQNFTKMKKVCKFLSSLFPNCLYIYKYTQLCKEVLVNPIKYTICII